MTLRQLKLRLEAPYCPEGFDALYCRIGEHFILEGIEAEFPVGADESKIVINLKQTVKDREEFYKAMQRTGFMTANEIREWENGGEQ